MENNNIVVAIHSKQNQAGNQHQIQIQNEAELTRMLLDILAKPATKDIESNLMRHAGLSATVHQMPVSAKLVPESANWRLKKSVMTLAVL